MFFSKLLLAHNFAVSGWIFTERFGMAVPDMNTVCHIFKS